MEEVLSILNTIPSPYNDLIAVAVIFLIIAAVSFIIAFLFGGKAPEQIEEVAPEQEIEPPEEIVEEGQVQEETEIEEFVEETGGQEFQAEYLDSLGVEYKIVEEDTYSIVQDKIPEGKTTCSLCSRLRRGILYRTAKELGATKIALGHHRDDIIETLFLNMFYGGKMKGMPPKLVSDNGEHVVIRPLAYCREKDIIKYSEMRAYPIIPCNLCGSQPNMQRQNIKQMLNTWDKQFPGRIETMFRAMQNVVPSHLADFELFDFKSINRDSGVINGGDIGFDKEEMPAQVMDDEERVQEFDPSLKLDVTTIS